MVPPATDIDEAASRAVIDQKLIAAGWVIQHKNRLNLTAGLGVAVREMDTNTGPADYMLFIEGKACGVIEAKREGTQLGGVTEQSQRYATSTVAYVERVAVNDQPLPFLYEATNIEIRFRDERDPIPRSRFIFHFHKPETLKEWLDQGDTLRARLQHFPELNTDNLRACQIDAIHGIERSLTKGKPRALLQMATGSGKTYTAVTQVYRLAKFAKIKRVLFLVDRGNLATNAKDEFEQFVIPNDGRKFTQHYNVNILGRAGIPDATKVTISTIQRMYAQLSGQELDDEADEHSGFEIEGSVLNKEPRPVSYNPSIPIEEFDVIIIDECHRSIYNLWRQVLDYFDAFLIGLTATPTKKTIGFFGQNLVSEYTHEDAVIDKVNVGYDKSRFVLVDCVGVTETDKTETRSLETKPGISTAKLMEQVARGDRHSDTLRALGNRMIRLDLKLNDQQRKRVSELAGKPLALIAGELIHETNEDMLLSRVGDPTASTTAAAQEAAIQAAFKPIANELIKPFHNPDLRELIEELRKNTDQLIDDSPDQIIEGTGYDSEKAKGLISNWQQFIKDHQNELDAIQLIYQLPYQQRHLSYAQIEKLAEAIAQPPYNLAPIEVWKAYEQLEKNKIKGVPPRELLTNIISLIRFSTGLSEVLEPFAELVNTRFANWLAQQPLEFKPEQLVWLNRIKDQIAQNAEMTVDDFEYTPFNQEGGLLKARELFGKDLQPIINELNGYLIA